MEKISKYHTNRKPYNWIVYNLLDKALTDRAFVKTIGDVVYDLGAGESPYREYFLRYAKDYVAVDWTGSIHRIKADINANLNDKLPVDSEVCDNVITISVLEHLHELRLMLSEAFRILKKKGNILIQVPWQWHIHEEPYDYFRYTPFGLKKMLQDVGFKNIIVLPQSGIFSTLVLKFNYFTKRYVHGSKGVRFLIQCILIPLWYMGQKLAPIMDRLDKKWEHETCGYIVKAQKI